MMYKYWVCAQLIHSEVCYWVSLFSLLPPSLAFNYFSRHHRIKLR